MRTTYIKAIPSMMQIADNRKKSQKERICYLYNGVLYNYQAIEVIIMKSLLNYTASVRLINKGQTIRIENKPIQKIVIKYK